ncbi:MAG: hypothetical protein J6K89_07460 [Oscillospiraceae bacterium]|nr:hypothetical protein [Oscillospiraceae bacterium]
MFRWIRRKLLFCLAVFVLLYYLNRVHPHWLQTAGRWIGGEVGNRVSVAVSNMLDRLGEGSGVEQVVEVFREGLQN